MLGAGVGTNYRERRKDIFSATSAWLAASLASSGSSGTESRRVVNWPAGILDEVLSAIAAGQFFSGCQWFFFLGVQDHLQW